MLENITERFDKIFSNLRKRSKFNESNIKEGVREIKLALLEADVNYKVVKDFVKEVEKKALGEKVLKSVTPTEQFVKIVNDEMIKIIGENSEELKLRKSGISTVMLVGLQGSGKTTTCAKLGLYLKKKYRVLVVGADVYRPAAKEQLRILAEKLGIGFYGGKDNEKPASICKNALKYANQNNYHVLIFDTAGRLQIDSKLMKELVDIKKTVDPQEILFVSDSMAGQNIVEVVEEFDRILDITGVILTKFDSDARGGAALSIKHVTGKSIKFIGTGEKAENLEAFHPDRIAGRILGRGDIVTLVEKAQEQFDEDEAKKLEKKFKKAQFDLNDFLNQMLQLKKLGSLGSIMDHLPLPKEMKSKGFDDKKVDRTVAIIRSMTKKERANSKIIDGSRRRRIALGSGTSIQEVNQLLGQFGELQKMLKKMKRNPNSLKGLFGKLNINLKDLAKIG